MVVYIQNKYFDNQCITKLGDTNKQFIKKDCGSDQANQEAVLTDDGRITFGTRGMIVNPGSDCEHVSYLGVNKRICSRSSSESGHFSSGELNWDPFFNIIGWGDNTGRSGNDAINNGAFKIQSKSFPNKYVDAETEKEIFALDKDDSRASQQWISSDLYKKCKNSDISFDKCTVDALKDCTIAGNSKKFDVCPKQHCQKSENVSKDECKNWCNSNKGDCDLAMAAYCKANPKNTDICGCYNVEKYAALSNALSSRGESLMPQCGVPECTIPTAYKSSDMLTQKCPDKQICLQGITAKDVGGYVDAKGNSFICNLSSEKTETSTKSTASTDDNPVNPPKDNTTLYLIVGGSVFFVFMIIMIMMMSK